MAKHAILAICQNLSPAQLSAHSLEVNVMQEKRQVIVEESSNISLQCPLHGINKTIPISHTMAGAGQVCQVRQQILSQFSFLQGQCLIESKFGSEKEPYDYRVILNFLHFPFILSTVMKIQGAKNVHRLQLHTQSKLDLSFPFCAYICTHKNEGKNEYVKTSLSLTLPLLLLRLKKEMYCHGFFST